MLAKGFVTKPSKRPRRANGTHHSSDAKSGGTVAELARFSLPPQTERILTPELTPVCAMVDVSPTREDTPESLLEVDQWLCWQKEERDGTPTEILIDPSTGAFALTTDAETWASFQTVREQITFGDKDGIGFGFTDDDPFAASISTPVASQRARRRWGGRQRSSSGWTPTPRGVPRAPASYPRDGRTPGRPEPSGRRRAARRCAVLHSDWRSRRRDASNDRTTRRGDCRRPWGGRGRRVQRKP